MSVGKAGWAGARVSSPMKRIKYLGAIAVLTSALAAPAAPQTWTPANPLFAGTSSTALSSPAWFFASYPGYASGAGSDACKIMNYEGHARRITNLCGWATS